MASLKVVSDRCDDNSIKFCVVVPPRRNGEVNFSAAEAVNRALLSINPGAFDPEPPPTAVEQAHRDGHTAGGGGVIPHSVAEAIFARPGGEPRPRRRRGRHSARPASVPGRGCL